MSSVIEPLFNVVALYTEVKSFPMHPLDDKVTSSALAEVGLAVGTPIATGRLIRTDAKPMALIVAESPPSDRLRLFDAVEVVDAVEVASEDTDPSIR